MIVDRALDFEDLVRSGVLGADYLTCRRCRPNDIISPDPDLGEAIRRHVFEKHPESMTRKAPPVLTSKESEG